jgi:hypothetical protein
LGVPDSVMGLTMLAAGGSLPEAFSAIIMARKGELFSCYVRICICYSGEKYVVFITIMNCNFIKIAFSYLFISFYIISSLHSFLFT